MSVAILNQRQKESYGCWQGMLQRTTNKNCKQWNHYGGRGIFVCKSWFNFRNFLRDMGERPSLLHSIERINNEKGYSPSNCKWATDKEQGRNKRTNVNITYDGKSQCVAAWAEEHEMKTCVLNSRLNRGWTMKSALTLPNLKTSKLHRFDIERNIRYDSPMLNPPSPKQDVHVLLSDDLAALWEMLAPYIWHVELKMTEPVTKKKSEVMRRLIREAYEQRETKIKKWIAKGSPTA